MSTEDSGERIARIEAIVERIEEKLDGMYEGLSRHMEDDNKSLVKITSILSYHKGWLTSLGVIGGLFGVENLLNRFFG